MRYEGRVVTRDGEVGEPFEFFADSNQLAEDHLMHLIRDPSWGGLPAGGFEVIARLDYRRVHHARTWVWRQVYRD